MHNIFNQMLFQWKKFFKFVLIFYVDSLASRTLGTMHTFFHNFFFQKKKTETTLLWRVSPTMNFPRIVKELKRKYELLVLLQVLHEE
jgi:hypothetical protein